MIVSMSCGGSCGGKMRSGRGLRGEITRMFESIQAHETAIIWIAVASLVAFIATLMAVPWLIVRIPSDYFAHRRRLRKQGPRRRVVVRWALLIGKNLLGCLLIAAGIAMLVLPGQGMLTILLGFVLMDLPGKYRFERWIVAHPPVFRSINRLRQRAGRAPLVLEE
jgi:hypothetical protein